MTGSVRNIDAREIHIWNADIRDIDDGKREGILTVDELERAEKYRFEADAGRYVKARLMLRRVLSAYLRCGPGEILFHYEKNGKPGVKDQPADGLQFNVSHSGDMVVIAVSRGCRVGIDIEQMREAIPVDIYNQYFSPGEAVALEKSSVDERTRMFYRIWTRKEAFLKATGQGLSGLSLCPDLLNEETISRYGTIWYILDLDLLPGFATALAVEGRAREVKMISWNHD